MTNQEFVDIEDGLIGTNVFSEFLVTLDFAAKTMRLDPLPGYRPGGEESLDATTPAGMQGWTRFFQFGHLLLIPTRVGESREALFVIDTGAARTLISYDMAAEVSRDLRATRSWRCAESTDRWRIFIRLAICICNSPGSGRRNQGMTSFDMWTQSRGIGTEISGFLGLPVLSLFTITLDYRAGMVKFDYKGP